MRGIINKKFTQPGLRQDVVRYVETCDATEACSIRAFLDCGFCHIWAFAKI